MLMLLVVVLAVFLMAVVAVLVDRVKRQKGVSSWYDRPHDQYDVDAAATQSRLHTHDDILLH